MKVNFHIKQNVLISDFGATNAKISETSEKWNKLFLRIQANALPLCQVLFFFHNAMIYD